MPRGQYNFAQNHIIFAQTPATGRGASDDEACDNRPDNFYEEKYAIPADLTEDKAQVTIRFQGLPGKMTGGVFGLRVVRESP